MESINIIPTAGLCNRLRVIFSYLKLANENNKTLNVFWQTNKACNGHFLDVFSNVDGINFIYKRPEIVDYVGHTPCVRITNKNIYDKLIPNEKIHTEIKELSRNNQPYNSVHIRRTDHIHYAKLKQKFTPDTLFENFIDKSRDKIYLACDNYKTQKSFMEKYREKIFVNKIIEPIKSQRQTPLEDAVMDLFMCVQSNIFLGTSYSSYSDLIKLLKR
jgi:hypothetical protein